MKLDKRIMKGKMPLTCFDLDEARQYIGKECYFSDSIGRYNNIDDFIKKGIAVSNAHDILTKIDGSLEYCFSANGFNYAFCLPCEWVGRKKDPEYRSFLVDEFIEVVGGLNRLVSVRKKDNTITYTGIFNGYSTNTEGSDLVCIGAFVFELEGAYKELEFRLACTDEWQPFGVLEN